MVRKHSPKQNIRLRARSGPLWIYGRHPAEAVLANPRRGIVRVVATPDTMARLAPILARRQENLACDVLAPREITRLLDEGARHQGVAVLAQPLPDTAIADLPASADLVLVLDKVSDPHNAGAIVRSAAAFGASAIVMQERNAPPASAALAKAASGALEWVPLIRVPNITRSLAELKQRGFWITGLDAAARETLCSAQVPVPAALVLGAEGEGLRRLTREACDFMVRIGTSGHDHSLNVSNAAAIALHVIRTKQDFLDGGVPC